MSPTQTLLDRTQAAGHWFLHSGVQENNGGVARYYRADLGQNALVSTEITGYAISTLAYLYERSGETAYLEAARRAAGFLIRDAWNAELAVWPFEHSGPEALAYFFDSGIIVRGLLALWRASEDADLLKAAVRGGESMGRHFGSPGFPHPVLELPSLRPLAYTPQWSRSPGCYQLKSAMAWRDLALVTGREDFMEHYEEALASALRNHEGFLPAETPAKTMDRLHAYCYFLEGMLPVADRPEARTALQEGIDRVAGYLRQIRHEFERSDVYAQLLRVRLLAPVDLKEEQAREEAAAIPGFQICQGEARVRGGYSFGRRAGSLIPHTNPVSTGFCLQALEMWGDFQDGVSLSPVSLI